VKSNETTFLKRIGLAWLEDTIFDLTRKHIVIVAGTGLSMVLGFIRDYSLDEGGHSGRIALSEDWEGGGWGLRNRAGRGQKGTQTSRFAVRLVSP